MTKVFNITFGWIREKNSTPIKNQLIILSSGHPSYQKSQTIILKQKVVFLFFFLQNMTGH